MSLLGVHIGVRGCTAAVYGIDGTLLSQESIGFPSQHPEDGAAELDAERVMANVFSVIKTVSGMTGDKRDPVQALSFSVQGEAIIPVDAQGHPLGPAITTFDQRPAAAVEFLQDHIGREALQHITGLPLHAMYSLPKILWWRNRYPELYEQTVAFLDFGSLFLSQLGIQPVMDFSMAGRTLLLDLDRTQWSEEILNHVDLSKELLPQIAPAGTALGVLPRDVANSLNLPQGIQVILGGHDQACTALACGVTEPGSVMDATSAVECMAIVLECPLFNNKMLDGNYGCFPHVVPERYLTLAYNFSAGSSLRWFCETLGDVEEEEAHVSGISYTEILLGKAKTGPSDVLVLSHFARTGTPWLDEEACGAIIGLTLMTSRAEIIKGFFDGMAYEMRLNLEYLVDAGAFISNIIVLGVGATSPIWLRLKADIYQHPVAGVKIDDAPTLGAAMLAGIGGGEYRNFSHAVQAVSRRKNEVMPAVANARQYDQQYRRYVQIYPWLKSVINT